MNDWIELGLFTDKVGSKHSIQLQKHRLHNGKQMLIIVSKVKPAHVSIDPRLLLIYTKTNDISGMVQIK
jgi:hypothetical protein